jgi:hypothetical protein
MSKRTMMRRSLAVPGSLLLRALRRLLGGVAAKFANTDFHAQKVALKVSLYMIMSSIEQKPEGTVHLERIAARHSRRGLDIDPYPYRSVARLPSSGRARSRHSVRRGNRTGLAQGHRVGIEVLKSKHVSDWPRRSTTRTEKDSPWLLRSTWIQREARSYPRVCGGATLPGMRTHVHMLTTKTPAAAS